MDAKREVELTQAQLRSLAKLSLACFIISRQGVGLKEVQKTLLSSFALYHGLDKDAVSLCYLQAMEALSRAPFVFCAIHSKDDYLDAVIQSPRTKAQVLAFVAAGLEGIEHDMGFASGPAAEVDLIIE